MVRKVVTLHDASQQLGVSVSTIRDWRLRRKHLDFVKVGRAVRVLQSSIDRLIETQTVPASQCRNKLIARVPQPPERPQ